jgi:hypothetical protein
MGTEAELSQGVQELVERIASKIIKHPGGYFEIHEMCQVEFGTAEQFQVGWGALRGHCSHLVKLLSTAAPLGMFERAGKLLLKRLEAISLAQGCTLQPHDPEQDSVDYGLGEDEGLVSSFALLAELDAAREILEKVVSALPTEALAQSSLVEPLLGPLILWDSSAMGWGVVSQHADCVKLFTPFCVAQPTVLLEQALHKLLCLLALPSPSPEAPSKVESTCRRKICGCLLFIAKQMSKPSDHPGSLGIIQQAIHHVQQSVLPRPGLAAFESAQLLEFMLLLAAGLSYPEQCAAANQLLEDTLALCDSHLQIMFTDTSESLATFCELIGILPQGSDPQLFSRAQVWRRNVYAVVQRLHDTLRCSTALTPPKIAIGASMLSHPLASGLERALPPLLRLLRGINRLHDPDLRVQLVSNGYADVFGLSRVDLNVKSDLAISDSNASPGAEVRNWLRQVMEHAYQLLGKGVPLRAEFVQMMQRQQWESFALQGIEHLDYHQLRLFLQHFYVEYMHLAMNSEDDRLLYPGLLHSSLPKVLAILSTKCSTGYAYGVTSVFNATTLTIIWRAHEHVAGLKCSQMDQRSADL